MWHNQTWGQFNYGIRIDGQFQFCNWLLNKKNGIGIEKFWIGIEVSYKKLNPQINLPFLQR